MACPIIQGRLKDSEEERLGVFERLVEDDINKCQMYATISLGMLATTCYVSWHVTRKQYDSLVFLIGMYCFLNFMHYRLLLKCLKSQRDQLYQRFAMRATQNDGWNSMAVAEQLSPMAVSCRNFKIFAHYLTFLWGNLAYFDYFGSSEADSGIKTVGLLLLTLSYLFSAFMFVGLTLTLITALLYLPFYLFGVISMKIQKIQQKSRLLKSVKKTVIVQPEEDMSCRICMYKFQRGQQCYQPCSNSQSHSFHSDCLSSWLSYQATCPVCRKIL